MATAQFQSVVQHLHRLIGFDPASQLSDADLVQQFLDQRDETAFETLIYRHGGMVLGVCRRLLVHEQDAEDVFQATFLALVREGMKISNRQSMSSWLFKVAYRIARKMRIRSDRYITCEASALETPAAVSNDDMIWRDVRPVLDEEVDRLPEKYRMPVVLCYLEGKTNAEAAAELGCPRGTVATRLAWARERLRSRLTRRGVTLSAAGLGLLLEQNASAAALPAVLAHATMKTALTFSLSGAAAAGTSAKAILLANAVVRSLRLAKLTGITVVLFGFSVLAGGVGWMAANVLAANPITYAERNEPGPAPDEIKKNPDSEIHGLVVGPDGKPASGVTVWVIGGDYEAPAKALAKAVSDEQGRFTAPVAFDERARHPALLARDAKGLIGWMRGFRKEQLGQLEFKLRLRAVGDATGRVLDDGGRGIAGMKVQPIGLYEPSFREASADSIELPAELLRDSVGSTNNDGTFTLHGLPQSGSIFADFTGSGYGTLRFGWDIDRPPTFRLQRPGAVHGRVVWHGDSSMLMGARLSLYKQDAKKTETKDEYRQVALVPPQPIHDDKTFQFSRVPPGKYDLHFAGDKTSALFAERVPNLEVKPAATVADIIIEVKEKIAIRGQVVDAVSGNGIRGTELWIYYVEEPNNLRPLARVKTDEDGRYLAYVQPGKITVNIDRAPEGYLESLPDKPMPRIDATTNIEYPAIKLERSSRLEGAVVDLDGNPVAGATIHAVVEARRVFWQESQRGGGKRPVWTTDKKGRFVVTELQPKDKVPVAARTDTAVCAGSKFIVPADEKQPLQFVLSKDDACYLQGVVLDDAAGPIRNATVQVIWDRDYVHGPDRTQFYSGTGNLLETCTCDHNGAFRTKAVWPGDEYHLTVSAIGFDKTVTQKVTALPGTVQNYGKITLSRLGLSVCGQVVDQAGRPLAGVRVFNSGDGPKPVRSVTDARGQFRLDDLFAGPVYVFAQKDGYRFTAVRAQAGVDVTVKLLTPAEKTSTSTGSPRKSTLNDEQGMARRQLDRLWALPDKARQDIEHGILTSIGRLDAKKALAWTVEVKGRYAWHTRGVIADQLAKTDVTNALEALVPLPDPGYHLRRLAEKLADSDFLGAQRFAEAAVAAARKAGVRDETYVLAKTGRLLVRLGRKEEGRKLIEEAVAQAEKCGTEDREAFARGAAAEAIAPFDRERALRLLKPLTKAQDSQRYLGWVAVALRDASLLPTAHIKMRVAIELARSAPADAIKLAESISEGKERAEAFAWIAVIAAAEDKKLSWALIDRSLDQCLRAFGKNEKTDGFGTRAAG